MGRIVRLSIFGKYLPVIGVTVHTEHYLSPDTLFRVNSVHHGLLHCISLDGRYSRYIQAEFTIPVSPLELLALELE